MWTLSSTVQCFGLLLNLFMVRALLSLEDLVKVDVLLSQLSSW
jgi:hypothetical protein